jgi:hypothetical protein
MFIFIGYVQNKINMKISLTLCSVMLILAGCKNEPEKTDISETSVSNEESITTKIADANGFENFEKVNQLNFTFNVKVNDTVRSQRSWKWYPKENKIELTEKGGTFSYIKKDTLDEQAKAADQKFINDTYWLLFPYQLMWSDFNFEFNQSATAPISQQQMPGLTVNYSSDGGYTPGDTYRLYLSDDLMVKEWTYESAGGRTLSTTWEDYETFNGITISKMRKSPDGSFQLYFTDIEVK